MTCRKSRPTLIVRGISVVISFVIVVGVGISCWTDGFPLQKKYS